MHQRDLATPVSGPSTTFAELSATIDRMAEVVRRLELRMKLTAAIANAAEVELVAEGLRKAISGTTGCNEPPSNHELARDDRIEPPSLENSISAAPAIADSSVACIKAAPAEAKPVGQEAAVGSGESAIAVSILNLYDRGGSFIKP